MELLTDVWRDGGAAGTPPPMFNNSGTGGAAETKTGVSTYFLLASDQSFT
jgi:hypothetical protein